MALLLRRAVAHLRAVVLAMPLAKFASQTERTDAADGDGPRIPGAAGVITKAKRSAEDASELLAARVVRHSKNEFKRLGISLTEDEPEFGEAIDAWRTANVARVGSLLEFERDELSDILSKGANKTVDELRKDIEDRLEVSQRKADLLARDQVLKLNADVTQSRQQAAGITEYVWTTSGDERVRDTHAELDGETFSWDDPPVTNEAGDRNHPGEDYQCRCIPFPVLPELDEDSED